MKRLSHLDHRSLPAQGWLAFARVASAVVMDVAGSRSIAMNETTNQMVPGEGSA